MCACRVTCLSRTTERIVHHRSNRLAFDHPLHDAALARFCADNALSRNRPLLHIAWLRFHILRLRLH